MMIEDNKLGLEEYMQFVYENISKIVVNRNYIENNQDFFNQLLFKTYEEYLYSSLEPISILKQIKHLEIFLSSMIGYKPDLELPEDYI